MQTETVARAASSKTPPTIKMIETRLSPKSTPSSLGFCSASLGSDGSIIGSTVSGSEGSTTGSSGSVESTGNGSTGSSGLTGYGSTGSTTGSTGSTIGSTGSSGSTGITGSGTST